MSWFEAVRAPLIIVGGIGAITFPIYYAITAPSWRHSELGRFLMMGGIGWASLYLSAVLSVVFPSENARDVIRLVLIVSAGSFAWYQVWIYRKVRREELARKRKEERDAAQ